MNQLLAYILIWLQTLVPVCGDCNHDGLLNQDDAFHATLMAGGAQEPGNQLWACDVNWDGKISMEDVVLIHDLIDGKPAVQGGIQYRCAHSCSQPDKVQPFGESFFNGAIFTAWDTLETAKDKQNLSSELYAPDHTWEFKFKCLGEYIFWAQAQFDFRMEVRSGSCEQGTVLGSSSSRNGTAEIDVWLPAGTYWLIVEGGSASQWGHYNLEISALWCNR